jgi:hypothetical protein
MRPWPMMPTVMQARAGLNCHEMYHAALHQVTLWLSAMCQLFMSTVEPHFFVSGRYECPIFLLVARLI